MANLNTPFGFLQSRGTGSSPTYEQVTALIAANNNTPIFYGDPVSFVTPATGYIQQAVPGTATLAGIFIGCKYQSVSQKHVVWSRYWPGSDANGDVEAYIINDPNAQFLVQGGNVAITNAQIGQLIQFAVGIGNTATGSSGAYVQGTGSAATLPFRIVALETFPPGAPGTDATTAYNRVFVAFNNVITRNNGATVGIQLVEAK